MNRKEFFSKYKDLFEYDTYSSTDENVALKSFILNKTMQTALNKVPQTQQPDRILPAADTIASFGTYSLNNEDRLTQTTTGGITPRSPRSRQLEALETTQREISSQDKLFHHNILFSPLRTSNNNNRWEEGEEESDEGTANPGNIASARSDLSLSLQNKGFALFGPDDLLGRAVDRANRPSPYKSPRQRLAQLTLARNDIRSRFSGPKTPAAPNYDQLNQEQQHRRQRQQQQLQEQQEEQSETTYLNVDPAMEYTSLSLQSTVSTPNSSILPSARTMSTIDSDAPELDPNNNQNAKTGMAAPFLGYGQGENKKRTRTIGDDNNVLLPSVPSPQVQQRQPQQRQPQQRQPQQRQPQQPQQRQFQQPVQNDGDTTPHPLGNVSPRNPTGILPAPGDMYEYAVQNNRRGNRGGGKRHQFPTRQANGIQSSVAGYTGTNVIHQRRAYIQTPKGSADDMNHLLFSNMSPGAGGGFNPDIAPKKRLEIPFDTAEERQVILNKLTKMLQKTTGRPFTGYVDDIPKPVLRRIESLFAMKNRRNKLKHVLEQDSKRYDKERQRQQRQQVGFVGIHYGL